MSRKTKGVIQEESTIQEQDSIEYSVRIRPRWTHTEKITRVMFCKRLEQLMNGENPENKIVNVQELGDGIGMTRQAVTKYLNLTNPDAVSAVPSILAVVKLAQFFDVTPNYLLGIDTPTDVELKLNHTQELLEQTGLERATFEKLCAFKASFTDEQKYNNTMATVNAVIRGALNELYMKENEG